MSAVVGQDWQCSGTEIPAARLAGLPATLISNYCGSEISRWRSSSRVAAMNIRTTGLEPGWGSCIHLCSESRSCSPPHHSSLDRLLHSEYCLRDRDKRREEELLQARNWTSRGFHFRCPVMDMPRWVICLPACLAAYAGCSTLGGVGG